MAGDFRSAITRLAGMCGFSLITDLTRICILQQLHSIHQLLDGRIRKVQRKPLWKQRQLNQVQQQRQHLEPSGFSNKFIAVYSGMARNISSYSNKPSFK